MGRRRVLFTACVGAAMLAGGSIVPVSLVAPGLFVPLDLLAAGSIWGLVVGLAAFLFADKRGEIRGRRPNAVAWAAGAAGVAGPTSWLAALCLLGQATAGC